MTADVMASQLMRLSIFRGLSLRQLREIARNAQEMPCSPGSIIIEEGAEADAAVLIISGEAARVSGPELSSRTEPVAPGSLLCESAMLVETHYGSTVVARGHVTAARITRDKLQALILTDPIIGECMLANLAGRLRRMIEDLQSVEHTLAGGNRDGVPGLVVANAARLAPSAA
jgi:CRP-like cAMP-binding protein